VFKSYSASREGERGEREREREKEREERESKREITPRSTYHSSAVSLCSLEESFVFCSRRCRKDVCVIRGKGDGWVETSKIFKRLHKGF
jgi:hypothetical protein